MPSPVASSSPWPVDPAPLLERESALASLDEALRRAAAGCGACVVVSGEAGLGKTRLLATFAAAARQPAQWLAGSCDPLHTPRPLGPLVDLAPALPPGLGDALHSARIGNGLFPALLDWLGRTRPTPVLVLEDLHWADDATLDAVRYLGRRIAGVPALLLLTLREDEAADHLPLRRTLAQLDASCTTWIRLQPLSAATVGELARPRGRDADELFRLTGGHPLFVQQLLASAPGQLPRSVRESVLQRLDGLGAEALDVLRLVSAAPGGLEWELLAALRPSASAALDGLVGRGLLAVTGPSVVFRHELARQAVHDAMPAGTRLQAHATLAECLGREPPRPGLLARRVHHAAHAGRSREVCALGTEAAREAAQVGSRRAAVSLLETALEHADAAGAPLADRASWSEELARLRRALHDAPAALQAWRAALALRETLGDLAGQASCRANIALLLSPQAAALDEAQRADHLAAAWPDSTQASLAAYSLAVVLANLGRVDEALTHARRAVAAAEAAGHVAALTQALSVCAAVELMQAPSEAAFQRLERSIALATEARLPDQAAAAWVNLAGMCLMHARFGRLAAVATQGSAYCRAQDLDVMEAMLRLRQALGEIETGRWDEALDTLAALDAEPGVTARMRATTAIARARVRSLRGEAGDTEGWEAHVAAARGGQTEFLGADVLAYAAEAAWLRGERTLAASLAREAEPAASGPWLRGRLRAWQRRSGVRPECDRAAAGEAAELGEAEPFALEAAGRWRAAHDAWQALGCPYEAALVLLAGDEPALREALAAFTALGARPAADIARRALVTRGARKVTRGPYRRAATHPHGLTAREQEVAALLAQGHGNAEIASRLHRSERTVEHHVSAVLAKLGGITRAQAVARLLGEEAKSGGLHPGSQ